MLIGSKQQLWDNWLSPFSCSNLSAVHAPSGRRPDLQVTVTEMDYSAAAASATQSSRSDGRLQAQHDASTKPCTSRCAWFDGQRRSTARARTPIPHGPPGTRQQLMCPRMGKERHTAHARGSALRFVCAQVRTRTVSHATRGRAALPRLFLTSSCTSPSTFASMCREMLAGRRCGSNSNVPVMATRPVRCSVSAKVPGRAARLERAEDDEHEGRPRTRARQSRSRARAARRV